MGWRHSLKEWVCGVFDGKVAPGVFAIVATDEPRVRADMEFMSMGAGPYYMLYRPFHLATSRPYRYCRGSHLRRAHCRSQDDVSEVVAVAKRNLKAGETGATSAAPISTTHLHLRGSPPNERHPDGLGHAWACDPRHRQGRGAH
jgi:predicted homoserine dehydrogenase-like protein